ncbi:MAG: hypothetical protein JRG83_20025 [Deltaproteobacteria bacterium]|nr:hypothetical protein [Deltaproteobacteria bacterium]
METLDDLRDGMLVWLAGASSLPTNQVLPTFRWLCEAKGHSFEEPSAECLSGVLDSLWAMALIGGSSRAALETEIAPFRGALAGL